MAKASEQFRQSDVVRWGVVALVSCGLAVLAANVSALLPQTVLTGLHSSRIEGVSVEQLRFAVANIDDQARDLRNQNRTLVSRFAQHERETAQAVRRIGALEVTLPSLVEARSTPPDIDRSLPTASIGDVAPSSNRLPAEGGSLRVETTPITLATPVVETQPLPAPLTVPGPADFTTLPALGNLNFGIALGPAIGAELAAVRWAELQTNLGPVLLGLQPVLASEATGRDFRIIAGPTAGVAEARSLCDQLEGVSIACEPMPYIGVPLD